MARPLKKFRAGSVSCALWENEAKVDGKNVTMLKATIERRYKDKDGKWQSSNSVSRNEIPLAIWCLQKAFDVFIEEQNVQPESAEQSVR